MPTQFDPSLRAGQGVTESFVRGLLVDFQQRTTTSTNAHTSELMGRLAQHTDARIDEQAARLDTVQPQQADDNSRIAAAERTVAAGALEALACSPSTIAAGIL